MQLGVPVDVYIIIIKSQLFICPQKSCSVRNPIPPFPSLQQQPKLLLGCLGGRCLNHGALITDLVRRWFEARWGTGRKVFILGYSCTQRFPRRKCLLLVAYTLLNRVLIKEAIVEQIRVAPIRGPLGRTVPKHC